MKKLKYIGCAVLTAMIYFGFTIGASATVTVKGTEVTVSNETSATLLYDYGSSWVYSHHYNGTRQEQCINGGGSYVRQERRVCSFGRFGFDGRIYSQQYSSYYGYELYPNPISYVCYGYYGEHTVYPRSAYHSVTKYDSLWKPTTMTPTSIVIEKCISDPPGSSGSSTNPYSHYYTTITIAPQCKTLIKSGTYKGYPAIRSTYVTIEKGVIQDYNNSHSLFTLGEDSEQVITTDGSTTITTVKLSNPPPPALQLSAA